MKYLYVETIEKEITLLTLNRPEKRNALHIPLLKELSHTFQNLSTRVVILQGEGPVFCAGMDLQETDYDELVLALRETFLSLYQTPAVTIAAVHGAAIAGGAGLLAACDLVFATPETKIGFPETRRGLVAAQVATLLLRQLAPRDVRELLLVGSLVNAERACQMRLVNQVTAHADLLPLARHHAEEVLQGGPDAVKATKHLLDSLMGSSLEQDLDLAVDISQKARVSSEAEEGISAFLEKRKPNWL